MKDAINQELDRLNARVELLEALLFKAENVVRLAVLYPTLLASIRAALGIEEAK